MGFERECERVCVFTHILSCSVDLPFVCCFLFTDQLREGVQFDASALLEIQLALYIAQEAVSLPAPFLVGHVIYSTDGCVIVTLKGS